MTSDSPPIRVVIVHGSNLYRAALTCLLGHNSSVSVVADCANDAALTAVTKHSVDIVLLSADHRDTNLRFVVGKIRSAHEAARVLLLAALPDEEIFARALEMGAQGVFFEHQSVEILVKAIRRVHRGEIWVDSGTADRMVSKFVHRPAGHSEKSMTLTGRERQVVSYIGKGLTNKGIAQLLSISDATVRNHLTSVFGKLGLTNRTELMVYAYRNGLAEVPARSTADA